MLFLKIFLEPSIIIQSHIIIYGNIMVNYSNSQTDVHVNISFICHELWVTGVNRYNTTSLQHYSNSSERWLTFCYIISLKKFFMLFSPVVLLCGIVQNGQKYIDTRNPYPTSSWPHPACYIYCSGRHRTQSIIFILNYLQKYFKCNLFCLTFVSMYQIVM